MEKKMIEEVVWEKFYDRQNGVDIKKEELPLDIMQPGDILRFRHEDAFFSDNNSYDEHCHLEVIRERLETDEEFEKRKKRVEQETKMYKKRRYESYLKLKAEFENDTRTWS
jgi:hypothetical protein